MKIGDLVEWIRPKMLLSSSYSGYPKENSIGILFKEDVISFNCYFFEQQITFPCYKISNNGYRVIE